MLVINTLQTLQKINKLKNTVLYQNHKYWILSRQFSEKGPGKVGQED